MSVETFNLNLISLSDTTQGIYLASDYRYYLPERLLEIISMVSENNVVVRNRFVSNL